MMSSPAEKFSKISIYKIPVGAAYDFSIYTYLEKNQKFVPILPKQEEFTQYHQTKWMRHGVMEIFVPKEYHDLFFDTQKLDWVLEAERIRKKSLSLTAPWKDYWQCFSELFFDPLPWSYGTLRRAIGAIVLWEHLEPGKDNEIVILASAAALADLGLLTLPRICQQYPTPLRRDLTSYEELLYDSHVERTNTLLKELFPDCPSEVKRMIALQHGYAAEDTLGQCFQAGILIDESAQKTLANAMSVIVSKEPQESLSRLGPKAREAMKRYINDHH